MGQDFPVTSCQIEAWGGGQPRTKRRPSPAKTLRKLHLPTGSQWIREAEPRTPIAQYSGMSEPCWDPPHLLLCSAQGRMPGFGVLCPQKASGAWALQCLGTGFGVLFRSRPCPDPPGSHPSRKEVAAQFGTPNYAPNSSDEP